MSKNLEINLAALSETCMKSQAVIEFYSDGTIIDANENFLSTMGYSVEEVRGEHHSMFCETSLSSSPAYKGFWDKLKKGVPQSGEFKRVTKDGTILYLSATYYPYKSESGKFEKVIKIAQDITEVRKMATLKQLVDLAPINVMLADVEGTMIYMNKQSFSTLKSIEQHLPGRVETFVGGSIDIFHKNPAHQKRIISDPKNLPHKAIISVGPEKLDLLVSAVFEADGTYVGPMVTWSVITERVKLVDNLSSCATELTEAAKSLIEVATNMSASAEETSAQSNTASSGSEEVAVGVQTVATNIEEMTASIKEITNSTNQSSTISNNALKASTSAREIIFTLGESSADIGNVIKVISSIAQQTNLLALNATIEAARAGEAGKGFAVVANEVKELAKQTASATSDITKKIEKIQTDSKQAVDSIQTVGEIIEQLNNIASSIAASVEEQAASTNEVSRVVQESADAVKSISENISQVSSAATMTGQGAGQTKVSALELQKIADTLMGYVKGLKD